MHLDPFLPRLVAAAFVLLLLGLGLSRLRLPLTVTYLLAGVALGPDGLGVFTDKLLLARVGDFGVMLLLFFVGMEVSLRRLIEAWRVSVLGTLFQVLASVGCVAVLGHFQQWSGSRIVLVGFAISLSSTAVVVSLLKDRKALETPAGGDALGILLVQDLALIPMLILLGFLGEQTPTAGEIARQGLGVGAIVLLLAVLSRRATVSLPLGRMLRHNHELQVFGALVLCFGLATLTAVLGLSTAVGAFVAGIVVGAARETDWVHRSLEPFRVVLVALFFVSVGMLIELDFLWAHWSTISLLVLVVFATNWAINACILRALGRDWRHSFLVAALLAQMGEFSFVLAAVGRQSGIIQEFAYQVIVGLIAITLLLSPLVVWLAEKLLGGARDGALARAVL